jgi:hypothetical protein
MVKRAQPFSLRVDEASLLAYKKAAEQAGMSVSEWARLVLDVSAGVRQIRHVYYIDVGSMEPEEAIRTIDEARKKVRTGKW